MLPLNRHIVIYGLAALTPPDERPFAQSTFVTPIILGNARAEAAWILAVGFLLDLAFLQLDRMYLQGRLERFSLDNEAGYAETYQNSKELVFAVLACAYLLRRKDLGSGDSFPGQNAGRPLVMSIETHASILRTHKCAPST